MKSKRAMPIPGPLSIVVACGDAQPDLMSAGAPSALNVELAETSDSQAGWSAASITKWDRLTATDRRSNRIRLWRRRALLKRGARLHAAMGENAKSCSLAMLDEAGVVVAWYGRADDNDHVSEDVVDRHVSLLYVSEEVARRQPSRDLRTAVIEGRITREAWRRRPDGSAFWGTIVIEPVVLRDGRVQGFSYVARALDRNRQKVC